MRLRNCWMVLAITIVLAPVLAAQTPVRVELTSPTISVAVGDKVQLTARVFDANGNEIDVPIRFFSSARRDFPIARDGLLQPIRGGEFVAYVRVNTARNVRDSLVFAVEYPALRNVVMDPTGDRFFVGASARHHATVFDVSGAERGDVSVTWSTDNTGVASVDRFG